MASLIDIVDRVVETLAPLSDDGWRRSVFAPELELDGEQAHKVWSVELPDTDLERDPRQRVRTTDGMQSVQATTRLLVRWGWNLPVDDLAVSYRAALQSEGLVISKVTQLDTHGMASPVVRGINRTIVSDGSWMLTTVRFDIQHPLGDG